MSSALPATEEDTAVMVVTAITRLHVMMIVMHRAFADHISVVVCIDLTARAVAPVKTRAPAARAQRIVFFMRD